MKPKKAKHAQGLRTAVLALSLVALCCGGLSHCTKQATALRLVITFSAIQLDQVSLTGRVSGTVRFTDKRFPHPPNTITSGQDIIIVFPDEDHGKPIEISVLGKWKGKNQASAKVQSTLRQGELVIVTAHLGPDKKDGGVDAKLDGGQDMGKKDGRPDSTGDGIFPADKPRPPDLSLPDYGCKLGTSFCQGDNIVTCSATEAGPAPVPRKCPLGCVVATTAKCRDLVPSNKIPPGFLSMGTQAFKPIKNPVTIDTTKPLITGATGQPVTTTVSQGTAGPTILVMAFSDISIPKGFTVKVTGDKALALVAKGKIEIAGTIEAMGAGVTGGPGGGAGSTSLSKSGEGACAGFSGKWAEVKGSFPIIYIVGGGGGACSGATGGKGGDGQFGTLVAAGGTGGVTLGNLTLVPLAGGSGGGAGGGYKGYTGGNGGGGGGALQIVSAEAIIVGSTAKGGINVGGAGGGASNSTYRGGGGGGSGGNLLLEAPVVEVKSGAVLAANGGGGGGGSGKISGAMPGSIGELNSSQTPYGTPSTQGGRGGYGGGGNVLTGELGSAYIAGGGGGGGAGIIRINTYTGSATVLGTISAKYTQGKVGATPP